MSDADYIDYLRELLASLGPVTARKMFGGWGLYADGRMFGLVADQRVYLKTDDDNRDAFVRAGCAPFVYEGGGKVVEMSYWSVPDEAMDSADEMRPWARRAFEAALRKAQRAPVRKKAAAKKAAVKKASVKKGGRSESAS